MVDVLAYIAEVIQGILSIDLGFIKVSTLVLVGFIAAAIGIVIKATQK